MKEDEQIRHRTGLFQKEDAADLGSIGIWCKSSDIQEALRM
jgi:hypothetical protein